MICPTAYITHTIHTTDTTHTTHTIHIHASAIDTHIIIIR